MQAKQCCNCQGAGNAYLPAVTGSVVLKMPIYSASQKRGGDNKALPQSLAVLANLLLQSRLLSSPYILYDAQTLSQLFLQ